MAKVIFTSNLKRFFPDLTTQSIEANTIKELIDSLELKYTGVSDYLLEEQGTLRAHVNIFIGQELIADRKGLTDAISAQDEVYIMQAISGG